MRNIAKVKGTLLPQKAVKIEVILERFTAIPTAHDYGLGLESA